MADALSRKRRRTTFTPTVEGIDRARSAPATDPRPSRRKPHLRNQATLTQIDFVRSNSYLDDVEVTRISDSGALIARRRTARPAVPKFQKQDSTLTQMGWVDKSMNDQSVNFDDLHNDLLVPCEVHTTTEPQDITHDLRTPSTTSVPVDMAPPASRSTGSKKRGRRAEPESESQDYQPTQARKRRKVDTADPPRTNPRRTVKASDFRPPLVIADSTDFTEISLEKSQPQVQPKTPSKRSNRIPSSQTPESLKPSTRKKMTPRQPLAELSNNTQISSPKKSSSHSTKKTSPRKSKICTLKVPQKALLPRLDRQESNKSDIWSVHATSSSKHSSSPTRGTGDDEEWNLAAPSQHADIVQPEQSNNSVHDTQKSLPDLDEIFRNPSSRKKTETQKRLATKTMSAPLDTTLGQVEPEPSLPPNAVNVLPDLREIENYDGSDSELGSPMRNDTQFVKGLHQRISSPSPTSDDEIRESARKASPKRKGLLGTSRRTSPVVLSPLPAPRLVRSPAVLKRQPSNSTVSTLPSVATPQLSSSPRRALERVRIVQVPLNDTAEYQKASSSPALPPTFLPPHSHIFPASIPHPSQVSTQAPSTQGFLPTTPGSISRRTTNQSLIEQIAISDSSSVPKVLSQYQRTSNSSATGFFSVENEDDESMDDLEDDLNPSTFPTLKTMSKENVQELRLVETQDETTQSPTQTSRRRAVLRRQPTTQSSPVITAATTRSQRDAKLEVIDISSSSQRPGIDQSLTDDEVTPKARKAVANSLDDINKQKHKAEVTDTQKQAEAVTVLDHVLSSPTSSSVYSPSPPRPLKRKYSPIPGFDNDTQSDFTQNGHVTAAYIHRAREDGLLPLNYTPKPYQIQKRVGERK